MYRPLLHVAFIKAHKIYISVLIKYTLYGHYIVIIRVINYDAFTGIGGMNNLSVADIDCNMGTLRTVSVTDNISRLNLTVGNGSSRVVILAAGCSVYGIAEIFIDKTCENNFSKFY